MSSNVFGMPSDMSDLCRVCLQLPEESQYLDLTTIYDEEENLTYGACFTICTHIDLSAGEGLPHSLCKLCGLELQMTYDFFKKIEESNQVIEQYQRQMEIQKQCSTQLTTNSGKYQRSQTSDEERRFMVDVINEKYVISDDEQLQASDETEECCTINEQIETGVKSCSYANEEANEMTETNMQEINSVLLEPTNMHDSEHIEIEDYQSLETLEEETETLQIKCDINIMPAHIRKFKPIECEDIEEYVEYIDEFKEEKENEEEKQDIDESYVQVINEEDTQEEDHLRWQDNVVVVANKEHLPIDVENYELLKVVEEEEELVGEEEVDVEREEQTMYIRSKQNNNKNALIINDSSQEAGDRERNTHDNNSTVRKRHVGSYSCDYCHRVYPNYSRMKTHRRCHETDRQKFSCSHCGRIYATKQARDCHVQTVHDKFGYTCDICNKVFAIRKSLEIHIRYHTGDFPYKCYMCDRKFAQSCHLNTHINVKHNKIRFSCDYPNCGKCFTSSSSLRNHEFTHGIMPFECKYCQQGFPAKSKLRVHIHRKHGMDMTNDQLEEMRKFHIMRSKVNLVQFLDS